MPARLVLMTDVEVPSEALDDCRGLCASFASFLEAPVEFWQLHDGAALEPAVWDTLRTRPGARVELVEGRAAAVPMPAGPFVWREDGRPDWGAMWTTFCELALFGGPPHRGPDSALDAVRMPLPPPGDSGAMAEIRRGIYETTGLYSEPAEPGWLAVTCHSRKMAAWLCAAIILENVDARCDEERLLVPADPSFALTDQVKSVITVVAKTHHYWSAHTATG